MQNDAKDKQNKKQGDRDGERSAKKTVFCFWLIKKCELFNVPIKMGINCVANVSITQSVEQIVDRAAAVGEKERETEREEHRERRRAVEDGKETV